MARIAGVDLPRNKRIEIALTYIYGIGRSSALKIVKAAAIEPRPAYRENMERAHALLERRKALLEPAKPSEGGSH